MASLEQTTSSKDSSNPLIAGMFAKNCMVINSLCFYNKELASPKQTAIGKDTSNPFIADMFA